MGKKKQCKNLLHAQFPTIESKFSFKYTIGTRENISPKRLYIVCADSHQRIVCENLFNC